MDINYQDHLTAADQRADKFADIRPVVSNNGYWRAVIWRWDGCINGSAQPFKVIDIWEGDEARLRMRVEYIYPGIEYAPEPQYLNGLLLP